ncbi:MAG TPA: glycosyl hydrolase family 28-related protein, partial [Bacteroidales bacterium]|nr:glycosyl hydrolase family 28-related protein [Bacteroidales bacterium]
MKLGDSQLLFSVFSILFSLCSMLADAQSIVPSFRMTEWQQAGLKSSLPVPDTSILLTDLGAIPNDALPDDDAFQLALDLAPGQHAEIYIPAGEYLLTQPLELNTGTRLIGTHADSVVLSFNLSVADDLISAAGSLTADTLPVAEADVHDSLLICQTSHDVQPGEHFFLNRHAEGLVTSDWALNSMGQIVAIKQVIGDSLLLEHPLRHTYPDSVQPVVIRIDPVENVQISKLTVRRIDSHDQQASNIAFNYAYNAQVHAIISEDCIFSHLSLRHSDHVLVEGS